MRLMQNVVIDSIFYFCVLVNLSFLLKSRIFFLPLHPSLPSNYIGHITCFHINSAKHMETSCEEPIAATQITLCQTSTVLAF